VLPEGISVIKVDMVFDLSSAYAGGKTDGCECQTMHTDLKKLPEGDRQIAMKTTYRAALQKINTLQLCWPPCSRKQ
jgi:hypothetical protein